MLGAIPVSDQQYWIQQVLEVFPEPPNRTNHDADYGPVEGLWAAAQGELRTQADAHRVRSGKPKAEGVCRRASNNTLKLNKGAENGFGSGDLESHHSRSLELQSEFLTPGSSCLGEQIHTPSGEARTSFKNECSNKSPGNAVKEPVTTGRIEPSHRSTDSTEKRRPSAAKLLRKLRWATLGLQYDWSSRSYIESLPHAPFPADLADLAARLAAPAMRHLSLQSFPLSIRTQQLLGRTASDCLEGNCLNGIESGREIETTSEGGWKNENEINGGRTSVLESERRQKSENGGERTGESESKAGRERRSRSEGRQESEKGPQGREGVSHSAEWKGEGPGKDFRAEGAIVNYYGPADALSGHLDDVEENMDLPIVSIRWEKKMDS